MDINAEDSRELWGFLLQNNPSNPQATKILHDILESVMVDYIANVYMTKDDRAMVIGRRILTMMQAMGISYEIR